MSEDFYLLLNGQHIRKLCEMQYEELMKKYSLRQIELEILYYLGSSSALQVAKEIVDNWSLSKAHVSKSLEHLRQGGFLQVVEDEKDHRCMNLRITDNGRLLIREIGIQKQKIADILFQGVTEEEREVITKVAVKMRTNVSLKLKKD